MKSKLESAYAKALTGTFKVINPIKKTIKKTECEVHLYIQENALEILNYNGYSDEYKLFKEYKSKIDEGLVWADQDFKCYHHFYNPKEEKGMYGYDDNALTVAKESKYTTAIYEDSQNCANIISNKMKEAGIKVNGVFERSDLTGFNWSQVPVVLVEMGFLSNYTEDQMMSNPEYQTKLMQAISDGLDEYFANK